jgi:hypothetical protein
MTYDARTMEAARVPQAQLSDLKWRTTVGNVIGGLGVAIGVGAFAGSGLVALGWAGEHLPGWNDSVFSWTLSIVGIIAGSTALASVSCLLAFAIISLGARVADPRGERERFWGVSRRERLFASEELTRAIANEAEVIAPTVRNAIVDAQPIHRPETS